MHTFSLRLVCGDWYVWLLWSLLICILFNFSCPKFKLLLRFLTIVTISHLKCCILNLLVCFYLDFILLTCILRQPVRLVGLVTLVSFRGRIFAVGGECDWSLVVSWSWNVVICMIFLLHSSFTTGMTGCVGHTHITLSFSVGAWLMIADPKIVTISTSSCVGRTFIYLFMFYFSCFGLLLGICRDLYD